ncbi:MAG: alpha/beta hydrolase [Kofleriaceae bacterium]
MPHIETRAGRIAVEVTGQGPAVFLLPANGHFLRDYDALVPRLSGRKIIAIDWPGFGGSDLPAQPATARLFYDVFCDVFDRMATGPAALIGHSVGGMVSVRFAAERPQDVERIAIVNSGGFTPQTWFTRTICRVIGNDRVIRAITPRFTRWYVKDRGPLACEAIERARTKSRASLAVEAAVWRSFARPDASVLDVAAQVRAPALIVHGSRDPVVGIADARRAHGSIEGSRLVELATGHAPMLEAPDAFATEVVPFLSER